MSKKKNKNEKSSYPGLIEWLMKHNKKKNSIVKVEQVIDEDELDYAETLTNEAYNRLDVLITRYGELQVRVDRINQELNELLLEH